MLKVFKVFLRKLRNGEYFQFMTDIKDLIVGITPAVLNVVDEFPEFEAA